MDGLSVVANIYAVIGAAKTVAEGLRKISNVRHAPQEVLQFINEISDFRVIAVKAQEVIRELEGSEDIGPLNDFSDSLEGIIERALRDIVELKTIIYSQIIIRPTNGTQSIKISRLQWFKKQRHMKSLLESVHKAKVNINSSLTLLTASHLPQLRNTLSSIAFNNQDLNTTIQQWKSNTSRQLSDIQPQIQSVQSSIQEINLLLSPTAHGVCHKSSYEFRTSIYARDTDKCPPACRCKCHTSLALQTPVSLRNLVGNLFIGYYGSPLLTDVSCNEYCCRRNDTCLLTVSYYFPTWFLRRMIFFQDRWTPTKDHMISIRTPRVLGIECNAIFLNAEMGNLDGMRELFSKGMASPFDVNGIDGYTLLYAAVGTKQTKVCEFLISQYADPEALSINNKSALDGAFNAIIMSPNEPSSIEFKRIFAPFLEDNDISLRRRFTTLHKIILKLSSIPLRSQLEDSTADINARTSLGETALYFAVKRRDLESMKILVEYGARIDLPDNLGYNSVHHTSEKFPEGLAFLLDAASKIDIVQPDFTKSLIEARTLYGDTPLDRACIGDHTGTAAILLLSHLEDRIDYASLGSSILYAIGANNHATINILLERGVDPNVKNKEGRGFLHEAACTGDFKTLNILLEADLRIQTIGDKDEFGYIPLNVFQLERSIYIKEDAETREQCQQVFLQLLEQQENKMVVVEEILESDEELDVDSSIDSDDDIFFDFNEIKE